MINLQENKKYNKKTQHNLATFSSKVEGKKKQKKTGDISTPLKNLQSTHQSTGSPASFWQEMLLPQHGVQHKNMTAISKNEAILQTIVNEFSCERNMAQSEKDNNFASLPHWKWHWKGPEHSCQGCETGSDHMTVGCRWNHKTLKSHDEIRDSRFFTLDVWVRSWWGFCESTVGLRPSHQDTSSL